MIRFQCSRSRINVYHCKSLSGVPKSSDSTLLITKVNLDKFHICKSYICYKVTFFLQCINETCRRVILQSPLTRLAFSTTASRHIMYLSSIVEIGMPHFVWSRGPPQSLDGQCDVCRIRDDYMKNSTISNIIICLLLIWKYIPWTFLWFIQDS